MMNKGNAMYAVALSIPNDDCNGAMNLQMILAANDNNAIQEKVRPEGGMYVGERLMIARPLENKEHAEHRLLRELKNRNWSKDSCIVFFVKESPCTEKCLNDRKNNNNILELLKTFDQWAKEKKAFLFQNIYYRDQGDPKEQQKIKELRDQGFNDNMIKAMLDVNDIPPPPKTRSQLLSAFQRIEEHVPLYRCNEYTRVGCVHCLEEETSLNDNGCLYGLATESGASSHQSRGSSSQAGSRGSHGQSSSKKQNERSRSPLSRNAG
ncbi:UNVERIFIED_CONTAM: hypothetical protein FKN15_056270 [Acipenser sinensis]